MRFVAGGGWEARGEPDRIELTVLTTTRAKSAVIGFGVRPLFVFSSVGKNIMENQWKVTIEFQKKKHDFDSLCNFMSQKKSADQTIS